MQPPRSRMTLPGYTPKTQAHVEATTVVDPLAGQVKAMSSQSFRQRFPGQLEHCQRLVAERLQAVLGKSPGIDLTAPATWSATPAEILNLASSLVQLTDLLNRLDTDPFQDLR